ncbi:MAG: isocitrate lyase/phosphoenolpyruvate mutase family protein [Bacteroidia bacterium]|nr:isocitrate lyase/phosphoenolpyruvate mutase family protein [Bacteroidia bacterium]MCZ2249061.1 isocitrate lyase/phosphoenolpyruvate mutase family protein [Bacteroidia bacterium]
MSGIHLQKEKVELFHALHHKANMLVLANAWDCLSAKAFENVGYKAIATTSAGVSWALGYMDGEFAPPDLMLQVIKQIARCVEVPVTADIEGGYYRNNLNLFSDFIERLIDTGISGLNLEDGYQHTEKLNHISYQTKEITTIKTLALNKGLNLFVNARTDAMLLPFDQERKVKICIERAQSFANAGADGIFIPFVYDLETIKTLRSNINLPINIMASDHFNIEQLQSIKINRLSTGARFSIAMASYIKKMAENLLNNNNMNEMFDNSLTYAEINNWYNFDNL